jgi:hypothetical protein
MKPRTLHNIRIGRILQRTRIEAGCMEQYLAAEKANWKENRIRDREIAVASLSLPELVRLSIVFQIDPVVLACRMISPFMISLNKTTIYNDKLVEVWNKPDKFGQNKSWPLALIETKFPDCWEIYSDFEDSLLYTNDTIDDIRSQIEYDIKCGTMKPRELVDTSHLGLDWEKSVMIRQGRNLKAARLKKSLASQWAAAAKLNLNASHVQVRESAAVSMKLEDVLWYAAGWDMSPYKLVEAILSETSPTDLDLRDIRRKYC